MYCAPLGTDAPTAPGLVCQRPKGSQNIVVNRELTSKANDIDQDAGNVCNICTPVYASSVIVRPIALGGVQPCHFKITFADEVVINKHHPSNGTEKHAVGREIGCEIVGIFEEHVGLYGEADKSANITSSTLNCV